MWFSEPSEDQIFVDATQFQQPYSVCVCVQPVYCCAVKLIMSEFEFLSVLLRLLPL